MMVLLSAVGRFCICIAAIAFMAAGAVSGFNHGGVPTAIFGFVVGAVVAGAVLGPLATLYVFADAIRGQAPQRGVP